MRRLELVASRTVPLLGFGGFSTWSKGSRREEHPFVCVMDV